MCKHKDNSCGFGWQILFPISLFFFTHGITISCLMKRVISCFNVALLSFKTLLMFKTARLPSNACSLHRFPELQLNRCSFLDSSCFCLFKKCVIWELSFQMLWVTWTGLFLRWPNVHCMSCHLFVLSKKCKKKKNKKSNEKQNQLKQIVWKPYQITDRCDGKEMTLFLVL